MPEEKRRDPKDLEPPVPVDVDLGTTHSCVALPARKAYEIATKDGQRELRIVGGRR